MTTRKKDALETSPLDELFASVARSSIAGNAFSQQIKATTDIPTVRIKLPLVRRVEKLARERKKKEQTVAIGQEVRVWIEFAGREHRFLNWGKITNFDAEVFVLGSTEPLHLSTTFQYRFEIVDILDTPASKKVIH